MERRYSIGELADAAAVSRRTIRFYVQRGIVPPPLGAGRGHYYTDEHLELLKRVRALQEGGQQLESIAMLLQGKAEPELRELSMPAEIPATPGTWTRAEILPGLEIHAECGRHRLTPARVRQLREAVAKIFGLSGEED